MDQQKLSFVLYVTSSLALIYAALINSPLQFAGKAWENTSIPAVFFGIVFIVILHIVVTGKMLSQEKFPKVKAVSLGMIVFAVLIAMPGVVNTIAMVPRLLGAFFS